MNVKRTLLMGLLVAGGGFAASAQAEPPSPAASTAAPATVPAVVPGMTVHIDPKTGAILKEAAPGSVPLQLTPQLRNALSTSHQGLVEEPSTVPGGGVKLDLQGRFQNPVIVTTDADGKVKLQHLHPTPEPTDKK
jgi:hypothetical protein